MLTPEFAISLTEVRQSIVPYASFGVITLLLTFTIEVMFLGAIHLFRDPFNRALHRTAPKLLRRLPHFDYFLCFLITFFIVAPLAKVFLSELFEPFLLTAHLFFIFIFMAFMIFVIYMLFEKKYTAFFKHSYR